MTHETEFRAELQALINRYSKENRSNTPDFILAAYMERCLLAFEIAVMSRESFYGRRTIEPNVIDKTK